MDCKECKERWRADKLIDEHLLKNPNTKEPDNYA
jgi:glycyl-tRNA synthetase (class II)